MAKPTSSGALPSLDGTIGALRVRTSDNGGHIAAGGWLNVVVPIEGSSGSVFVPELRLISQDSSGYSNLGMHGGVFKLTSSLFASDAEYRAFIDAQPLITTPADNSSNDASVAEFRISYERIIEALGDYASRGLAFYDEIARGNLRVLAVIDQANTVAEIGTGAETNNDRAYQQPIKIDISDATLASWHSAASAADGIPAQPEPEPEPETPAPQPDTTPNTQPEEPGTQPQQTAEPPEENEPEGETPVTDQAQPTLGLAIANDYSGTVTFMGETAGYRNTLGMFEIAEDGSFRNISILFANSSSHGSGGDLTPGESSVDVHFSGGTNVGFFLLPNGYGYDNASHLIEGQNAGETYEFRDADGNAVDSSHVGGTYLWHIAGDGTETQLNSAAGGAAWLSTASADGSFALNADGSDHTRFSLAQNDGRTVLDMGFEDLFGLGDQDYDDTVFRVDIGADNTTQVAPLIDATFVAEPLADLTILDISLDNDTPALGEDVYVRIDVANIGDADAYSTSSNFYWSPTATFDRSTAVMVDSDNHGTLRAGDIDYGETERIRYEDLSALGNGYIFGVIDDADEIAESDGTNNVSEGVAINFGDWTGLADLHIDDIWAPDTELAYGQDMFVNVSVTNSGYVAAANTRTTYYWSATDTFDASTAVEIDADNHGTLKIGETDTNEVERIRYEDIAALGDGYIFGVIDAANTIAEGDETNNVSEALAVTLDEVLPPDLTVDSIKLRSASLSEDENLVVKITVGNQGVLDTRSVSTTFYWSATDTFDASTAVRVDSAHQGRIRADSTKDSVEEIKYSKLANLGDGYIFAVVDDANAIAENDETNNVSAGVRFTLEPIEEADLQITRLNLSQGNLQEGEDAFVFLDVTNGGRTDARSVSTQLFWSPTDSFDTGTAVALENDHHGLLRAGETEVNESTRIRYEDLAHLGNGFIFGVIDNAGAIDESNNGNNVSGGAAFFLV